MGKRRGDQLGPVTKRNKGSVNVVESVSKLLSSGHWDEALKALEALRRAGEVPKLGAVQRWVRLADLVGEETKCAALLAAILRAVPGSQGPLASKTPGPNKQPAGAIRRHEAWSPPLTRSQVQVLKQGQAASQPEGAAPKEAARSADCSPGRPSLTRALALVRQQQGHQLNEQQDKEGHAGEGQRSSHSLSPDTYRSGFSIVQQDVSLLPAKRPPNWQELKIWAAQPGLIQFDNVLPQQVQRVDVPFVPGAFVLCGLLTPHECAQLVAATEALGYAWDVDYSFNPSNPNSAAALEPAVQTGSAGGGEPEPVNGHQQSAASDSQQREEEQSQKPDLQGDKGSKPGSQAEAQQQQQHPLLSAARQAAGGDRAAGCVWLADDSLLGPIFRRAAPHLPQKLCGNALAGLNARLRFYRYDKGNVYRPHVDGAWPGSGLRDGKLVHDVFRDRWSRLTFLVYLNDDFQGGSTTFFTAAADNPAALDARGVRPVTGNVLVFPHGDTAGSLVHEGSAVTQGAKYVIRTDVLYLTSSSPSK